MPACARMLPTHVCPIVIPLCMCQPRACLDAQDASKGINPRTKEPYKRGAYNKDKANSAAGDVAALQRQAREQAAWERSNTLRTEVASLRAEIQRLNKELEETKSSMEAGKRAAVLEATQKMATDMLQRYKDGLKDGASLSRGGATVNLASATATPDSSQHATSSPAFSWS